MSKPELITECRRCGDCRKASTTGSTTTRSRWPSTASASTVPPWATIYACDGTGIDPDAPGEVDCEECDGHGVVMLGWFVPLED